jgi:hypothetical protein
VEQTKPEVTAEQRTFDRVHLMVKIGQHPDHRAIRERTESRLAALKASGNLTEDEHTKHCYVNSRTVIYDTM